MNFTVTSVLSVLMALPSFIKLIKELMGSVQDEFGKGTGPDKKVAVMTGLASVVGDDTIWQKVQGLFSMLIDVIAIFKPKTT